MHTLATFVISSRLAVSVCVIGSLVSVSATDVLAQSGIKRIAYADNAPLSGSQAIKSGSNSVLARNATPKAEATIAPTVTKAAPPTNRKAKHDPKAVGRCWNRLMEMIREARQVRESRTE